MVEKYEVGNSNYEGGNPGIMMTITKRGSNIMKTLAISGILLTSDVAYTSCSEPENGVMNVDDKIEPTLDIWKPLIYIKGDEIFKIGDNYLEIGGIVVANRNDDSGVFFVTIEQNGQTVHDGDQVIADYLIEITIKDGSNNTIRKSVVVENELKGLENITNMNMVVGQEVNLLEGIKYRGKSAEDLYKDRKLKVEIDGEELLDPTKYVPKTEGKINIVFEFNDGNNQSKYDVIKNINAAEYEPRSLETVNYEENFPWWTSLEKTNKDFYEYFRDRVEVAYFSNYCCPEQRPNVIFFGEKSGGLHAEMGEKCASALYPKGDIQYSDDIFEKEEMPDYDNLGNYINDYDKLGEYIKDGKNYIINCSSDYIAARDYNILIELDYTKSFQNNIINNPNVVWVNASGNDIDYVYPQNYTQGNYYNGSSLFGNYNKRTSVGYIPGDNNYFGDGGLQSCEPRYFHDNGRPLDGNIVIKGVNMFSDNYTQSSFATSENVGELASALNIIMHNHSFPAIKDASKFLINNYLKIDNIKHKNSDGSIVDAGIWCEIDYDKFEKNEMLPWQELDKLNFSTTDEIILPSGDYVYTGDNIQFEYNGKRYKTSIENQIIRDEVLKNGYPITWRYIPNGYNSNGNKGFTVSLVKDGKEITQGEYLDMHQ